MLLLNKIFRGKKKKQEIDWLSTPTPPPPARFTGLLIFDIYFDVLLGRWFMLVIRPSDDPLHCHVIYLWGVPWRSSVEVFMWMLIDVYLSILFSVSG